MIIVCSISARCRVDSWQVLPRNEWRQTACKPGSVKDDHSSGACVTACLTRPARTEAETPSARSRATPSLFGLAPGGVYRAVSVAEDAVRSYRTVSPLPERSRRRFVFCGTIPGVASAGRYPAPCFRGARTFLPRGTPGAVIQPSGHGIQWDWVGQVKPAGAAGRTMALRPRPSEFR